MHPWHFECISLDIDIVNQEKPSSYWTMHRSLAFLTLIQFTDPYGQNVMVEPYLCVLINYVKKFADFSFDMVIPRVIFHVNYYH